MFPLYDLNGKVILTVGDHIYNVVLTNGNGSYIVYGLMNGEYNVKVEFAGNENYTNSSSAVKTLVVNRAETTVSLSDVTIEEGAVATIKITVTEGATGVVNVTVNGITQSIGLIDSKATVYVPNLRNGSYPITVKYGGDDKHLPSENITQHIYVNKVSDYDFTVIASDTVVGGNSTVTVYMPRDANGNITIGSKTTKVVGGKAVIVLDKEIAAGKDKEVTVIFGHDSKYADKTVVAKYNVDKAPSSVKIDVNSLYVIGDTVTITLTPVNGTATVKINDKNYVYFGPYPKASNAREIVDLMNQLFPLKKCRILPKKPCLYYHLNLCKGWCINKVSEEENKFLIDEVKEFLNGKTYQKEIELKKKI